MWREFSLLLFLVLNLVFATTSAAEPIKLVSGNDYQPFTDEKLPQGGLSSAIVRRVFQQAGREVELDFMPWSRGYESTKNSVHDATFPYVKRSERVKDFHYSAPINAITQLVYVQQGRDIDFQRAGDLAGLSTCVPQGYALTESVGQLIQSGKIQLLDAPDINECFLMLKYGRVDFLTFNQYVGWSAAHEVLGDQARQSLQTLEQPLETETLHLIVSRAHTGGEQLIAEFDKVLSELRKAGTIQKMEQDYLEAVR